MQDKCDLLAERVAVRIAAYASQDFNSAVMSDLLNGGWRNAKVSVTVKRDSGVCVVVASGKDAVFVEFGAGVYHNGAAGSSPHPDGKRLGMLIGSYGEGRGKRNVWGYYDGGELILTHGTPARMPMYSAMERVCRDVESIAKEVFAS